MSVTLNGETKRIGLWLSGGGFCSAAFHLGVMRQLATLGLLDPFETRLEKLADAYDKQL